VRKKEQQSVGVMTTIVKKHEKGNKSKINASFPFRSLLLTFDVHEKK